MYVDEQADAGRDCRTRLAKPKSQARTRTGKYYRKERSKRPGTLKIEKTHEKTEEMPRGALIYFKKKTPRDVLFRAFSRGSPRGANPRHEKVCEKDLLPKRKGTLRSIQWRNSTGIFFLLILIHQFKLSFLLLYLDQRTQHDQTNNFFLSGNAPGGALCPIFVLKNAPGALFRNCFMERPGGRLLRFFFFFRAFFPVQPTTSRIGKLTRLIHTNGRCLSWIGLTWERWCCTRG